MEILTSTPRKEEGSWLHISDPMYNRGKAKIINSFQGIGDQQTNKEQVKGGKKKSLQGAQTKPQPSTSSHISPRNTGRPQVHCSACGSKDHLRKDCHQDPSVLGADQDCMPQKCVAHQQNPRKTTIFASTVAATATYQANALADQMTTERGPGQHGGTSKITDSEIQVILTVFFNQNRGGFQQARFDERFNRHICLIVIIINHPH